MVRISSELTFAVADDGLLDVLLLQRHVGQLQPLVAVARVEVCGDQAELQRLLSVPLILVDHRQSGERLIRQRSYNTYKRQSRYEETGKLETFTCC